jgi:hypothetical protein
MRTGTLRCPCCRALENKTVFLLTFACACRSESCHRCHKCLSHCQCEDPFTWREFLAENKRHVAA